MDAQAGDAFRVLESDLVHRDSGNALPGGLTAGMVVWFCGAFDGKYWLLFTSARDASQVPPLLDGWVSQETFEQNLVRAPEADHMTANGSGKASRPTRSPIPQIHGQRGRPCYPGLPVFHIEDFRGRVRHAGAFRGHAIHKEQCIRISPGKDCVRIDSLTCDAPGLIQPLRSSLAESNVWVGQLSDAAVVTLACRHHFESRENEGLGQFVRRSISLGELAVLDSLSIERARQRTA